METVAAAVMIGIVALLLLVGIVRSMFAKPHLKSTLAVLYVIGMIALAATIGWLPFGWIAFWLRKEWVADDYYRAAKAAADAERVREEARRQRELRQVPPPSVVSLYAIFGLSEKATDAEIRAAYRRLVRKYHPDRSKYSKAANAEMFRQVQVAYAELRARRGSWAN
jgi:DnaJ domain